MTPQIIPCRPDPEPPMPEAAAGFLGLFAFAVVMVLTALAAGVLLWAAWP